MAQRKDFTTLPPCPHCGVEGYADSLPVHKKECDINYKKWLKEKKKKKQ